MRYKTVRVDVGATGSAALAQHVAARRCNMFRRRVGIGATAFSSVYRTPNGVPKSFPPWIHIPLRPANALAVCPQLESAEHNRGRLSHGRLTLGSNSVDLFERSLDQQRIVDWSAYPNCSLRRQAARQPQHFSTVGLHWKICQRPRVTHRPDVNAPPKDRFYPPAQNCRVNRGLRPNPKRRVGFFVEPY